MARLRLDNIIRSWILASNQKSPFIITFPNGSTLAYNWPFSVNNESKYCFFLSTSYCKYISFRFEYYKHKYLNSLNKKYLCFLLRTESNAYKNAMILSLKIEGENKVLMTQYLNYSRFLTY